MPRRTSSTRSTSCSARRPRPTAAALVRIFWDIDVVDAAPRLRCPTLVCHARGDAFVPFEEGRKLAGLIPGARFVPLESRNHELLEGEPAWRVFVREVRSFLAEHGFAPSPNLRRLVASLTSRERDILERVAEGLANDEIAKALHISEKTVRNHVSAVLAKLEVASRSHAIVLAREAGFGKGRRPA
jgi:DNA-binding CsgD family transcriptional regulator